MNPEVEPPPLWRMPRGVNASLWDYARSERLAAEEDAYFRDHPLFLRDAALLDSRFSEPTSLIDLGCGAGRLSLHFARKGFAVTAIDLSFPMLSKVREKARGEGLDIRTVRANLCDMGAIRDGAFGAAIAMFSTLGMIRGAALRRRALAEFGRVLQPGGVLAMHAHNLWLNLHDPQGRRWLLGNLFEAWTRNREAGDRRMTYRGIPAMEVHLYRFGELRKALLAAGLAIEKVVHLDATTSESIPGPWFLGNYRAGGWVIFARRRDEAS